ncbi:MAG: hypothetical protein HFI03_07730 [Lachnospiraceae bacterium]|nr:hypothetical protein [Lachnospiraceae bacterium]
MDKYEYKVRAEEIKALIAEGEFAEAVKIADTIDWRRVKSVMMLCTISDLYKINRRFQESKDILLMAYERHPGGRLIVYSLCELSIKMGEFVQAIEYYKEFAQIAPKDTGRYILQYKLYEAQDVSLEERIAVLEEFKKRDYRERWAYELAYLYHRVGLETKCVEECDEMFLWFGDGRHVMKALELKMLHQPLTAPQQEKYEWMKREKEEQIAGLEEEGVEEVTLEDELREENDSEERLVEEEQTEEAEENIADFSGYAQPEEEFKVKTIDMGQYNTINLQKELAESMKEILGEEEKENASDMDPVTEAIVAPLLQETGDILQADKPDKAVKEPEKEEVKENPAAVATEREEVFFEEDVKDILLEDTKEISIGKKEEKLGDTKEITPRRSNIPIPVRKPREEEPVQPVVQAPVQMPVQAGPYLMKTVKPSGFEQMLSQEYDGQISLVVPNKNSVEKQITGQLNITDIMAEWERMKRENEEKRREDVRKRVQQHTGNMFSEFDEATKTGLLEQLEKAVIEAILKESAEKEIGPEDITEEKLTDIVKNVGKKKEENKEEEKKEEEKKEEDIREEDEDIPGTLEEQPEEKDKPTEIREEEARPTAFTEEPEEKAGDITGIIDLEKLLGESTDVEAEKEKAKEKKAAATEGGKLRPLSDEEKELFGRFAHNRKTKEQIIHAIETMSMDSYSGNVIVTGEEGAGTLDLAKGLVRMLQMSDRNFSGKVAKISGDTFNKKDVDGTLSRLTDGALIIEHATKMNSSTAEDLNKALVKEGRGLFVVIEGRKDEMNLFLRKNAALLDNFNARIDVESLDDHSLVEYARQYAEEMEYSIDELGILALHTRIADMQTSDHEVTVTEVKDLVDDAIYFADKKNPKHFFDILFGKRYDEDDMVILREKDFMHY